MSREDIANIIDEAMPQFEQECPEGYLLDPDTGQCVPIPERQSASDIIDDEMVRAEISEEQEQEYLAPEADIGLIERLRGSQRPSARAYVETMTTPEEEKPPGWTAGATILGEQALRGATLGTVGLESIPGVPEGVVEYAREQIPDSSDIPAEVMGELLGFVPWMAALGPVGGKFAQFAAKQGVRPALNMIARMMVEGGIYGTAEEAANAIQNGDRTAIEATQNIVTRMGEWGAMGAGFEAAGAGTRKLKDILAREASRKLKKVPFTEGSYPKAGIDPKKMEGWKPEKYGPTQEELVKSEKIVSETKPVEEAKPFFRREKEVATSKVEPKTSDEATKALDDVLDELEAKGLSLDEAYKHPEAIRLSKIIDDIDLRELKEAHHDIKTRIKQANIDDDLADTILEHVYQIDPKSELGVYFAAEYGPKIVKNRPETAQNIAEWLWSDYARKNNFDPYLALEAGPPQIRIKAAEIKKQAAKIEENVYRYFHAEEITEPIESANVLESLKAGKPIPKEPVPAPKEKTKAIEPVGAMAGIQTDEEGEITFDPEAAALGVLGMGLVRHAQRASGKPFRLFTAPAGERSLFGLRGASYWEGFAEKKIIEPFKTWKKDTLRKHYINLAGQEGWKEYAAKFIRNFTNLASHFPEYAGMKRSLAVKNAQAKMEGMNLGKLLSEGLSKEEQQAIARIMKQEGVTEADLANKKLVELAGIGREAWKDAGKEYVRIGALSPETYEANLETYLPRMYRFFEDQIKKSYSWHRKGAIKRTLERAMRKKDIPIETRMKLDEVMEAGYPTAKGITQVKSDVARSDFFTDVKNAYSINQKQYEFLDEAVKPLFAQIPTTTVQKTPGLTRYGDLSGQYVPREIADDMMGVLRIAHDADALLSERIVGWWKYGKAIMNPATQVRNIPSNMMLNDINNGVSPWWNIDDYVGAAIDFKREGPLYKQAQELGLFRTGFVRQDTFVKMLDNFEKLPKGGGSVADVINYSLRKGIDIPGEVYTAVEDFFRLTAFKKLMRDGLTPEDAAERAIRGMLDYDAIPPFIAKTRRAWWGSPFITFTYKALPAVMEGAARHPLRFLKWFTLPLAIEEAARHSLGLSRDKLDEIRSNMPDYMQKKALGLVPMWSLIPYQTDKQKREGKYSFYDWTYVMPGWGDLFETGQSIIGLPKSVIPFGQGPFIEPMINLMMAKKGIDMFRETPLYEDYDNWWERLGKYGEYVYEKSMPSLTPGPEWARGHGFDKIYKALSQTPHKYTGDIPTTLNVMAGVLFGQKTKEISPEKEMFWRGREKERKIKRLKGQITTIKKSRGLTYNDKLKQIKDLTAKLREVEQGLR